MTDIEKMITDVLTKCRRLIERIDELPPAALINLYALLETGAQISSENIKNIDTRLRVELCQHMDLLLDHIIDHISFPIGAGLVTHTYSPAVEQYRRWMNVELMKDKGLVGYLVAKETGSIPVMQFCTKPEDYPYLSYLPNIQLQYSDTEDGTPEVYYEDLINSYQKMDILILHGLYGENMDYLNIYRKLRPDGKVYCGLDMNSVWMKKTDWEHPAVQQFGLQSDLWGVACRSIRDKLNENPSVSFPCHYFANGFYNPTNTEVVAKSGVKENIIITVGRIGNWLKSNLELMMAFAQASDVLKDWRLKFIGGIEPEFQPMIEKYFIEFPELRERVIFTGPIPDKGELYGEYAKAKIFVLTSLLEGGTPNVYAEALFHGCKFITSNIDGADDITNRGELGIKYKSGDIEALAYALIDMCGNADTHAFDIHIPKALAYANRYFDWNRIGKKLAYALLKPAINV